MAQPLRPLTISELLDRTFAFYRAHFVTFVGIAAIPTAFLVTLQLFYQLVVLRSGSLGTTILAMLVLYTMYLVVSMVTHGATVVAVSQVQLGVEPSVSGAYDAIRDRVVELVLLGFNIGLRVLLGLILLIVPGIYLALRYALAVPAAVIEDAGISGSLARSGELTRGHLGRVFLIYTLLVLLIYAGTVIVQIPVIVLALTSSIKLTDPPLWIRLLSVAGSFFVSILVGPITTIGLSLVYFDERVRKEGFDLEHMLQQLDGSGLNAPPIA